MLSQITFLKKINREKVKNPENRSFKIVYCEKTKAKLKKGKKYFCTVFLPLFKNITKNEKIRPPKKLSALA